MSLHPGQISCQPNQKVIQHSTRCHALDYKTYEIANIHFFAALPSITGQKRSGYQRIPRPAKQAVLASSPSLLHCLHFNFTTAIGYQRSPKDNDLGHFLF
ncbi:hypothetical protein WUBG_05510 [Wuchereria bancrofti]|uniref:Uncharacterized protein n=1 Tax=Wuchereria bancrofti TaxID=6293 RepID=J9F2B0_WUCBA|nr:hypothetical protein WUBG_05510 [Wuchereria bancrofti]VDM06956.1 unnamed protein product [Wuchereria bancrofti]